MVQVLFIPLTIGSFVGMDRLKRLKTCCVQCCRKKKKDSRYGRGSRKELVRLTQLPKPQQSNPSLQEDQNYQQSKPNHRQSNPPLHLRNGDLVLGGGGQEGEAARGRAEDVSGEDGGEAVVLVLLAAVAGVPEAGRGADDGGEEAAHLLLCQFIVQINRSTEEHGVV